VICDNVIPNYHYQDSKRHNISNRKTCVKCVPLYSVRNGAVRYDRIKTPNGLFCKRCNKELTGKQRKYCSKTCQAILAQIAKAKRIKQKAIDYKGGKCAVCGYNNCNSALEFHHKSPEDKEMNLSSHKMARRSWDIVKKELDKCIMLCANCHREIHENIRSGRVV